MQENGSLVQNVSGQKKNIKNILTKIIKRNNVCENAQK